MNIFEYAQANPCLALVHMFMFYVIVTYCMTVWSQK